MDTTLIIAISWIVITVIFAIIEAFTFGLTTIWFALGALAAMVFALFGVNIWIQVLVFVLVSAILLIFTRPIAIKHLHIGSQRTNVDSLIGASGIVTKEILPHQTGQVKVKGQVWTSISFDASPIEVGKDIEVLRVEGVKLIVKHKL